MYCLVHQRISFNCKWKDTGLADDEYITIKVELALIIIDLLTRLKSTISGQPMQDVMFTASCILAVNG